MSDLKSTEKVNDSLSVRSTLERYERSKVLEVYFARMDSRIPKDISKILQPLYDIDLDQMRAFLSGHSPQENIFRKIFKIMN